MSLMAKTCDVCGSETARIVCQSCGRLVCENCLAPAGLLCRSCYVCVGKEGEPGEGVGAAMIEWPREFRWFMVSFFLVLAGMLLMVPSVGLASTTSGGVLIFIGPIPIVIGQGPVGSSLMLFGALLLLVFITLWFLRPMQ